jgi:glycosyltransferase involved in cell wall biosynthesis
MPRISVIIITYNFEKFIGECIESILNQTLPPYEIIVSDDHSTDDSWRIICDYKERYPNLIKAFRHERNMGIFYNGTFGANQYTGDFISLMDGDDRWEPQKLELEWKALQNHPGSQIAYSNVLTIDEKGRQTGIYYNSKGPEPPSGDIFHRTFSKRIFPKNSSIFRNELVSRTVFDNEGHCDNALDSFWDWDRKIRYTARYTVAYSGKPLVEYRHHASGHHLATDVEKLTKGLIQVYEKNLPLLLQREDKAETIKVKCHIESLIARNQMKLSKSKKDSHYAIIKVYNRYSYLIKTLSAVDRTAARKELISMFFIGYANEIKRCFDLLLFQLIKIEKDSAKPKNLNISS